MKTPALSRRSLLKTAAAAGAAASVPTLASSAALEPAAETGHIRNFDMIEAFYREAPISRPMLELRNGIICARLILKAALLNLAAIDTPGQNVPLPIEY